MASTNEDVTVLATAPLGDDRLLILRHLPDRGTVEFCRATIGVSGARQLG